ncbi:Farnesyl pyrophosphate synthetase [Globomyces sp. JEL0801]|nr:Farnesyl pyrophosphate synthetase [Globomyces sp. JEL0801]
MLADQSKVTSNKRPATESAEKNTMKKKVSSEVNDFMKTFELISTNLMADLEQYKLPENGKQWFKNMFLETVPGGKMNRGLTVPSALSSIFKRPLTEKEQTDANLQAFFLIADDIMDSSITRRGQPCWYKRENVGMVAINDSFIIEAAIYKLLKRYFKTHPAYGDILELFHETTFQTELGQLMDLITAPEGDVDLARFSIEKHAYIVEFKTAYYSFYLPIALAMRYAGITDETVYDQAKSVLLALGEYFQVQDDYLDCFGSPEVIGKIGTDIEDNKCGWLIVQALSRASEEQRKVLDENYGQKDASKVALVKNVYKEIGIEDIYHQYEEDSYKRLSALIETVDNSVIPQEMFVNFMNRIYKRKV